MQQRGVFVVRYILHTDTEAGELLNVKSLSAYAWYPIGYFNFVKPSDKDIYTVNYPIYRYLKGVFNTLKYAAENLNYSVPGSAPISRKDIFYKVYNAAESVLYIANYCADTLESSLKYAA